MSTVKYDGAEGKTDETISVERDNSGLVPSVSRFSPPMTRGRYFPLLRYAWIPRASIEKSNLTLYRNGRPIALAWTARVRKVSMAMATPDALSAAPGSSM